nr:putative ribonuclease H-like domain-containing protein [Tanacetum cinerariifolium]
MRIEQYFLITDYSLWEVILNGNSPVPTRIVKGVVQPVAPTTAEKKLARKNELKARGTLLMALPDKHRLKFKSHKDAKTLMEAIEKRFRGNNKTKKVQKNLLKKQYENFTGSHSESLDQIYDRLQKLTHTLIWRNKADLEEQSLDDLFNSLKIYEAEVKHSSSTGTTTQNLAFVSSSNTDSITDLVSAAASVSIVCVKMPVSSLPNVDSLSNAIDVDDLKEMDLRWQMAMLTMRARRKGHFSRECRSPKDSQRNGVVEPQRRTVLVETSTYNALVSQCDGVGSYDWSYQAEEEPANFSLMAFSASSSSFDTEVPSCSKACSKAYAQLHSQYDKLTDDFRKSQFDVISYHTESDCESWPPNSLYDRFQPSGGYHVVLPPTTGTFMPPKPDLVFHTAPIAVETDHSAFTSSEQVKTPRHSVETSIPAATHKPTSPKSNSSGERKNKKACFVCKSVDHLIKDCDYHAKKMAPTPRNYAHRGNHKQYPLLTHPNPQKHMVPAAVLTQSKPVSITAVRPVSADVPKIMMTRPRLAHLFVTKSKSSIRRHITYSQSPNGTMLTDLLLPIPFWAKAVNAACYVQNRVLVTKPHNKTLYELLHGRTPSIGFMRPFSCHVTILNTLDPLSKFKGKVDEGFLVGYFVSSKAFRVFNSRTRIVQETLHVNFLKNKPNVAGSGPTWLFDIDSLTRTMNYQPVIAGNQTNHSVGFQDKFDAEKAREEVDQQYMLFPAWSYGSTNPQIYDGNAAFDGKEHDFDAKKHESEVILSPSSSAQSRKQDDKTKKEAKGKSHVKSFIGYRDLSTEFEDCSDNRSNEVNATELEDITYSNNESDVGAEADFNNLETSITMFNDDFHTCMFACFLSQEEPKRVHQALKDPSWIEAMQEEPLQFKMQKVWVLVDLPHEKRAIGTKWAYRNKKDERGIVVKNKARLVAQGYTQEERIDYKEVFAPVAMIEAIRLFLAYASFMGYMVYQMNVNSTFLYGTIKKEVYVCQPPGFEDPDHPDKVYKVVKAFYGLHQAPRACQDKYVAKILRKFGLSKGKSASTPIDTEKPLLKDPDGEDVDVHTYRSMIGSLMYLTSSRPGIMFA